MGTISEQGKSFIKARESCRLAPHWDAVGGVWDIGWGHVFKPGEDRHAITQEEADDLFDYDILYYVDQVESIITAPLLQCQLDALVSLTYNIGSGAFRNSQVAQYVNGELHSDACVEMLTWRKSQGKNVAGLLNRRALEVLMYAKGVYDS